MSGPLYQQIATDIRNRYANGEYRAGQSLPRSIELVASEAPSPTAEQFHRIAFELRGGRDLTESIERCTEDDDLWIDEALLFRGGLRR